jgi:hypothetical protein
MNEVDAVFPRSVGGELWAILQTLQTLPDAAKPEISAHLKTRIQENLTALAKIKDKPGNIDAYFHIGTLFYWDFMRIHFAGTMQERAGTLSIVYPSPDRGQILGLHNIIAYFLDRYLQGGGTDPTCVAMAKSLLSGFKK